MAPSSPHQIGRCLVVRDPWGNEFILPGASKGLLIADADGNIVGHALAEPAGECA